MEDNKQVFSYRYSAASNQEVINIRKKYLPKEVSKIEQLKELDRRVQSAGVIPALTTGIIGALIFGIGMCFGLDVFGGADWLSVLFCVIGAIVMIPAYPTFRHTSRKVKRELTPEILKLSDEIMKKSAN